MSGLQIGWAFAWQTLIGAEHVFGATSSIGGLGRYIFHNRNQLYTNRVFAGLASVILIGLCIENVIFQTQERLTVQYCRSSSSRLDPTRHKSRNHDKQQ